MTFNLLRDAHRPAHGVSPRPPAAPDTLDGMVFAARRLGIVLGVPGLLLIITGAFLPWLVSGSVRRSSFAVAGVADRIGVADGLAGSLVAAWPAICAAFVLPVLVAAFRWWRTAGAVAVVLSLLSGGLSAVALWFGLGAGSVVRLDPTGPTVMVTGSLLFLAGGLALLRSGPSSARASSSGW